MHQPGQVAKPDAVGTEVTGDGNEGRLSERWERFGPVSLASAVKQGLALFSESGRSFLNYRKGGVNNAI